MISISAAALILTFATSAPKTTIFGDVITSWSDYGHGQYTLVDAEGMSFDQADLGLYTYFNSWVDGYARLTLTGSSSSISEAYLKMKGLPHDVSITIGKFYKPFGAPIPLASLSFPAILLHSSPEYGLKLNLSLGSFDYEVGVVNGNPIVPLLYSTTIAGSYALTTGNPPTGLEIDNNKDYYGRIAWVKGEDWGSLTLGATYTGGHLSRFEINGLNRFVPNNLQLFKSIDYSSPRSQLSFDLDYQHGPWRVFGEYADAQDGRLRRKIWSTAGSYTFYPGWGELTSTIGYDHYTNNAEVRSINLPQSWNRNRTSFNLSWKPNEVLQWQAEYDLNRESVLQTDGRRVKNNVVTIQTILYF